LRTHSSGISSEQFTILCKLNFLEHCLVSRTCQQHQKNSSMTQTQCARAKHPMKVVREQMVRAFFWVPYLPQARGTPTQTTRTDVSTQGPVTCLKGNLPGFHLVPEDNSKLRLLHGAKVHLNSYTMPSGIQRIRRNLLRMTDPRLNALSKLRVFW